MTDLLSKEKISHILADLEAEDEIFNRQQELVRGEEVKGRQRTPAEMALGRNAGRIDLDLVSEARDLSWAKEDNIEKDGCQFIDAIYLFLDELGCPPDARDFVLAVAGISRGNFSDMLPITDDQIAKRMGFERNTIRRKRQKLIAWEQKNDWSVLEIHEKEFIREKMKYKPNEYKVTVIPFASRFVREYRKRTSSRQGYKALESSISEETKEIALKITEDLPNAPIVERQKRRAEAIATLGKPKNKQIDYRDSKFLNAFKEWCVETRTEGLSLRVELEKMQWKINKISLEEVAKQEN